MAYTDLAERPKTQFHPRSNGMKSSSRQAIHHPHTSLGAAGHWIHLASVAAPLVIGEVIKDSDKRWRALRLVSVGAALASEAAWTLRVSQDRKREEKDHAALEDCREQNSR